PGREPAGSGRAGGQGPGGNEAPGSGREAGGAGARPVATGHPAGGGAVGPGAVGPGVAGRPAGLSVTATWTVRPSLRESASVIAGRSFISIWSRVNASGTDSSAVSSTIARSRVSRRYARC